MSLQTIKFINTNTQSCTLEHMYIYYVYTGTHTNTHTHTHTHTLNLEPWTLKPPMLHSNMIGVTWGFPQVQMVMSTLALTATRHLCLVRSLCLLNFCPHVHMSLHLSVCSWAHVFLLDTSAAPLLQILNNSFLSWHAPYHLSFTPMASTSTFTMSLQF